MNFLVIMIIIVVLHIILALDDRIAYFFLACIIANKEIITLPSCRARQDLSNGIKTYNRK